MGGEDTTEALGILAEQFDVRAKPAKGRYVDGGSR
jgi:hypothetical protein